MGDDRNAARPEPRFLCGPRDLAAEFGRKLTEHGRDVDPDLLEDAAVHQRDRAATATRPLPVLALEPTGRQRTMLPAGVVAFDRLEGGADPVAQRGEPYRGALLTLRIG